MHVVWFILRALVAGVLLGYGVQLTLVAADGEYSTRQRLVFALVCILIFAVALIVIVL